MTLAAIELVACAGGFLLLDQWSKRLVLLRVGDAVVRCGPLLRVRKSLNSTRSVSRRDAVMLVAVWCAALASAIVLHEWRAWFQTPAAQLGLAAAFGGAAGNLTDMLRCSAVVDFLDLGWWPVFNLADVAIVGGLLLAFLQP